MANISEIVFEISVHPVWPGMYHNPMLYMYDKYAKGNVEGYFVNCSW